MDSAVSVLSIAALVWVFVDTLRSATNKQWSSVVTQATAWAAGIAAVFLFGETQWASTVAIGDLSLGDMDFWTKVVAGLSAASVAGVGVDVRKAVDNTDSAAKPSLVPDIVDE